jgi:putative DNA primase/helicase
VGLAVLNDPGVGANLREELIYLPSDWRLVRVGPDKRPIGANWQSIPGLSPDDAIELETMPPAFGLLSGPQSGCIVLDLDGEGWREDFLKRTGHPIEDLPETIAWTSGKPGRSGRAFAVDPDWWPHLANRKPFESDAGETLWELRGDRHQAVIIGVHPETGSYNWLPGCSPQEIPEPAGAPDWLLELLTVQEIPQAKPVAPQDDDADRAIAMLAVIPAAEHSSYDGWLRIGMALHSVSEGLLSNWVDWSRGMDAFDEDECLYKWQSFGKSNRGRPATIASLHFLAKQYGYKEPPKRKRKSKAVVGSGGAEPELQGSGGDGDGDGDGDGSPPQPPGSGSSSSPEPAPYTMLGFSGDDYYYQPKGSGQVTRIARGGHTSTNLFGIAPIEYWRKTYPRFNKDGDFTGIDWQQCYSDLLAEQHSVGCYDPSRIRGVGAWWDEGRTVFHLGDRLIVDGIKYPVKEPHQSDYIYQRLPKRIGPGAAEPLTDQEGANLLSIAEQFHWETPASGMLLAGWVALAPICGALEWRPHIWISAVSGSGKTTVFNEYITPLITDVVLKVKGNTTEAGIRQRLKSDALPVMFDEAESNEKADITRIQSVLSLARVASSEGDGDTLKGSANSEAIMFNVRSMFVLSSVNTALKQGADRNRFSLLMLRTPDGLTAEAKAAHWKALESDLVRHISRDTGKRLLARMINLIPMIRAAAEVFSSVAAVEFNSARTGDQVGTLLAGAWALQSTVAPTPEQALAMIRCANWDRHGGQPDEAGGDQGDCLQVILQTRLRVEVEQFDKFGGGHVTSVNRTISELIEVVEGGPDAGGIVTIGAAEAELGRNGLKIDKEFLVVSNVAKGIKAMLRETQWHAGGWPNLLASLQGAKRYGVTRFKGLASTTRAVGIPLSLLAQGESAVSEPVTVQAAS